MKTIRALTLFIAGAFLLAACGPGPKAKDPSDVSGGGGDGINDDPTKMAVPKKPTRKVSKEAKNDFLKAVKQYESAKKAGINRGNCGGPAGAFAALYQDHPKLAEAKFNEGVIWEECNDVKKAMQVYEAVLRNHPNFGPALNNIGQIYFTRGNVSQAVSYFKRSAQAKTSEAYSNMAVLQRNRALAGDPSQVKEAMNNVHRALAVDSANIEAYVTKAMVLYDHAQNKSQLEMARLICVQATKVDPDFAPIYNTLGLILLRQKEVTPALAKFRKAVALDNAFKEANMNIGAITLNFRDYKSAETAFEKVLAQNPDKKMKMDALVGLGVAYRGQRKFTQAMTKYKAAQGLDPTNVALAYNMGILIQDYQFDAANPAKAIQDMQRASNLLNRYLSGGRSAKKKRDVKRRLKNIRELIPMLREQQKMMQEMKRQGGK
jgi:tetratricopeptide (TPR) repeat protein